MKNVEDLLLNPQQLAYDFYGKRIWMLLNVELWFRAQIDRTASV
jgi:asparagine synthase (glutamine-hydrolysing)